MPRYSVVLIGLAALASVTGVQSALCGTNEYMQMDGAYTSTAANAVECVACPDNGASSPVSMTTPTSENGGYGDTAAPRYAAAIAKGIAAAAVDKTILTFCSVPAGNYLSAAVVVSGASASPGDILPCTSVAVVTAIATTITGATDVQTDAVQCITASACSSDEYLELNGAYSSSAANAPVCTSCPDNGASSPVSMTAPAGNTVTLTNAQLKMIHTGIAAAAVDTNLVTFCSVPAGNYLSAAVTATSPGDILPCTSVAVVTAIATTITGATAVQTDAVQCFTASACSSDEYLELNGAYSSSAANAPVCTACPAGMTATQGTSVTLTSAQQTLLTTGVAASAVDNKLVTFCDVPAGSWLSAAVTSAASAGSPGAVSSCSADLFTTSSPLVTITGATAVQTAAAQCTKVSLCAANEYLESNGGHEAAVTPFLATSNVLVCTGCPTGMTSKAGSKQGTLNGDGAAAIAATTANNNLLTFCDVPDDAYLSTAVTATSPGARTACGSDYTARILSGTVITGPTAVQVQAVKCVAIGAAGADGADGADGAAGADSASPAAPLSTITAAVFGAVVPAILILV